jgi:hypothetical protein
LQATALRAPLRCALALRLNRHVGPLRPAARCHLALKLDKRMGTDQSVELMAEVLASSSYQEHCVLLFNLFQLSRETDKNPQKILAVQAELIKLLVHFQNQKSEFKTENNKIGQAVVKRLILILKQIADSIVWRVLGYDRILVQLLAEHPPTGHLDKTVFYDFAKAGQIIEKEGAIVLINDLTTILRHGDLTIIGKNRYSLLETKYGKASSRNVHAIRQRRNLEELINFLNTGVRIHEDRHDFIFKVDTPIHTYQFAVEEAITQAGILSSNC